jgi:putative endonuclease
MQNYFVYAIKSEKDGRIYVGMSSNPEKRLLEHNSGSVFSTKGFRPWILIFLENTGNERTFARIREKYWKSGCGKEVLKNKYSVVAQR